MTTASRSVRLLAAALLSTLAGGCLSQTSADHREGDWLVASAGLAQQIEDNVTRLPWTHGVDRVELIGWFASVGEPAYDSLLTLCLDPRPDVASSALGALGATGDSRLVRPIRELDWPEEVQREVEFERARALVRLGDWSQVERLINGLSSEELWARRWSIVALEEATKQTFGFEATAEPAERAEAVARWRAWIDSRKVEGVLGA